MTAAALGFDPLRDKAYQSTRLGRSVADFLAWKKIGGAADRTLDQYEHDLSRACLMFPDMGLEEFGASELLHVANSFRDAERRVRVAAYRSFFKWAVQQGLIDRNPVDRLPDIKGRPQKVVETFTDTEIDVLTSLPVRDGALFQLLFDAGLRKSEARHFKLIHLQDSEVRILNGKGGKDRVIPATEMIVRQVSELALLDGIDPGDYLWWTRPGGGNRVDRSSPVAESAFHRWWVRCLEEAGIRYRNPHTTRHTFATRYLRRGGRVDLLSMAMGHASIATTVDLYGHLDTRDLAAEFSMLFPVVDA